MIGTPSCPGSGRPAPWLVPASCTPCEHAAMAAIGPTPHGWKPTATRLGTAAALRMAPAGPLVAPAPARMESPATRVGTAPARLGTTAARLGTTTGTRHWNFRGVERTPHPTSTAFRSSGRGRRDGDVAGGCAGDCFPWPPPARGGGSITGSDSTAAGPIPAPERRTAANIPHFDTARATGSAAALRAATHGVGSAADPHLQR